MFPIVGLPWLNGMGRNPTNLCNCVYGDCLPVCICHAGRNPCVTQTMVGG